MTEILYLVFVIFINESNSTISDFNACNNNTLLVDRLHSSFCMHMYGCALWNLTLYSPVCEISHSVFEHVQYSPVIRYW